MTRHEKQDRDSPLLQCVGAALWLAGLLASIATLSLIGALIAGVLFKIASALL